jgi:hypothetical protein
LSHLHQHAVVATQRGADIRHRRRDALAQLRHQSDEYRKRYLHSPAASLHPGHRGLQTHCVIVVA